VLKQASVTGGSRLTSREVIETWWPLALSWLLMIGEMPLTSAIISRLPLPEVNLAAWGIVFNLAIMIQAPGTMLLAASTAMVVGAASYLRLRRIAFSILAVLTLVHVLIGFTPLFDLVLRELLGLPPEVVDASRMAMMLVVPWSFGTGTRRFFHGILIRYGQSRAVIAGTLVRLTADIVILGAGLIIGSVEGATLTAAAMTAAVLLEALYAWLRVRPVIRDQVLTNTADRIPFAYADFARFYTPLVVTTLLSLSTVTLISAALARMPGSLASLATWPVVFGFLMLWQSVAFAYQEVVISMLRRPGAVEVLLKVTKQLALGVTLVLGTALITPLAYWWFHSGAALPPELTSLAQGALLLGLFIPALRAIQSWQQGTIVYGRNTGPMLESVVVFLAVTAGVLALGMSMPLASGLYAGMAAYALGMAAQTAWLAIRIRPLLIRLRERDAAAAP
jgi:hypothetical protein